MTSNQARGYPGQANLPNRMVPGPSVEGPDPNAMYYSQNSGPPPTFNMMPPSLPNGQPGYASLPNRMTPGPYIDPASDATRSAKRRAPNS
ncbi:hypothetical protein NP233_g3513 [Leucocoprinus birnbaumii]|uniref:Uncharacterized protein n=1 Tax=Leucocoprinus birnbaumii TaxID=56174 RepID=A0AAD5VWW2_9AGAR|nr:hypothetical protein NP233_g3513 [Leucocoprinus birnbaumii]